MRPSSSLASGLLVASSSIHLASAGCIRRDMGPLGLAANLCNELPQLLSRDASIIPFDNGTTAPPRWSAYGAPSPAFVANIATEQDVADTVKYCVTKGLSFLAVNGGNGWATEFKLGSNGVLINLAKLNQFTLADDQKSVTIGGGTLSAPAAKAAYDAGVVFAPAIGDCVGILGAALGGGYNMLMGRYSLGLDNIVSLRAVLADGTLCDVSEQQNPELYWAMRGAGPNFGIVTSAVFKTDPVGKDKAFSWNGQIAFSPDKLEQVVAAINDLHLEPEMSINMLFVGDPTSGQQMIAAVPNLFQGTNETYHQKFASIFAVGAISDQSHRLTFDQSGVNSDGFCARGQGQRRPAYGAAMKTLDPPTWRRVFDIWSSFQKTPGAESSAILMERYSLGKMQSLPGDYSAFGNRDVEYNVAAIPQYTDPALDKAALAFAAQVRNTLRSTDGIDRHPVYINYGHGDEDLASIYGSNLPRLKALKQKYDPKMAFNQWFSIH